ncbi:MAG: ubiquinol oxidase subunit II [Vulcanimicrobiaceae bacterium]
MSPIAAISHGGISNPFSLLSPAGLVGADEKTIILLAIGLMLIVVVPVIVMTFLFARRYRASNARATYTPKWTSSRKIEVVVWLVPIVIVSVLSIVAWKTTHALSPYRPLAPAQQHLNVDVVAMNWKWLFIYPDQHIATVNQLVIPTGVPVSFRLTSDSVLASFFIPRLGSQIYAMPGMQTKLHLVADRPGTFIGRNYQFSGAGYSWMQFKTVATSKKDFDQWVNEVKESGRRLDPATLKELERPSVANPVAHYASVSPHLFAGVIHQVLAGNATSGNVQTANGA